MMQPDFELSKPTDWAVQSCAMMHIVMQMDFIAAQPSQQGDALGRVSAQLAGCPDGVTVQLRSGCVRVQLSNQSII